MKKFNYFALFTLGIVLISCGGKNSDSKEGKEVEVKVATITDCLITELDGIIEGKNIAKKGTKDLYTGLAVEKDQNDSIIRKVEIKNGWLIKDVNLKKIQNKYIITKEFNYENGEITDDNFELSFSNGLEETKILSYVSECSPIGDCHDSFYDISIFTDSSDDIFKISFTANKESSYNFLKEFIVDEYNQNFILYCQQHWEIREISLEKVYQILDAMKKELPHFDYWKK